MMQHDDAIQFAIQPTSIGTALVAMSVRGVCAVLLGDDARALEADLRARFPRRAITPATGASLMLARAVAARIDTGLDGGVHAGLHDDVAFDVEGTSFQRAVWSALREIPAGATATYAEIAMRIGRPSATRAVAQACAANPVAVLVPCHRAVRSDGALSGYRWGVERKRQLLTREQPGRA